MTKKYSYKDVIKGFLSKEAMTHKKLQKITYYAEAGSYALFDDGLLSDTCFQAGIHGPVSPEIGNEYKNYLGNDIPKEEFDESIFDERTLNLLDSVWYTYGKKSGFELEALTHSEDPGKIARNGLPEFERSTQIINPEDMKRYYKSIYIKKFPISDTIFLKL